MEREYTAVFKKGKKWIVAWVEEIPGVNTQGKTMKEARKNLHNALTLMLEYNKDVAMRENRSAKRETIRVAVPA